MTIDEAVGRCATKLDQVIEGQLLELEGRLRRAIAATGPEDEAALDRPPDPHSPWRRATVEEAIMLQRERFEIWRAEVLRDLRRQLQEWQTEKRV
jgi:hypothetical protein